MTDQIDFPVPRLPEGLDTPAVVVDLDIVEGNIASMAAQMRERGVALRPHAKTHKSVEIGKMQLAAGAGGLTVGTLGEAEVMAEAGIRDLFIAYPLWASAAKAPRLRALHEKADLIVGVDSEAGAQALAKAVEGSGRPLRVAVEVDSGGHRTGVGDPRAAARVATAARAAGLDVVGVFTHGGHGYVPGDREKAAGEEVASLGAAQQALREAGIDVRVVSAGSTPTAAFSGAWLRHRGAARHLRLRRSHAGGARHDDRSGGRPVRGRDGGEHRRPRPHRHRHRARRRSPRTAPTGWRATARSRRSPEP